MINKSIDYDLIIDKVSIAMNSRFKVYEDKLRAKDNEIADLRIKNQDLENRCTELEQYTRKKTLKIEGVEEKSDEDPFQTVLALCDGMKLDHPMQIEDIDNCHRVGREQPADGRPRAIIVKLSSYRARKRFYDAHTNLAERNKALRKPRSPSQQSAAANQDEVFPESSKPAEPAVSATQQPPEQTADRHRYGTRSQTAIEQEPTHDADSDSITDHETSPVNQIESPLSSKWPIYINEALCKSRSKLNYTCRQLKHSGKINDTWTTDGRIKVRTIHNRIVTIETAADLSKYE